MDSTPQVFISRAAQESKNFIQILHKKEIAVEAVSLLEFSSLDFGLPIAFDWLFFYSKNGLRFFFAATPPLPQGIRIACIGKGTAEYLKKAYNIIADFVGDGKPQSTASAFLPLAKAQKVVFVRAADSRCSVQQLLSDELEAIDCIVYQNNIKKQLPPLFKGKVLVFTSPLNAKAYLSQHKVLPHQKIVAIGPSTFQALASLLGIKDIYEAIYPDEESLAQEVLKLL